MASLERSAKTDVAPPASPETDEALAIHAAGEQIKRGSLDAAVALLTPWLDCSEFPDTFTLLARALVSAGKLAEAKAVVLQAEKRFPDDSRVWKALAVLYRTLMQPALEIDYRRKLVYLRPDPPLSAYARLAEACSAVYRQDASTGLGDLRFIAKKVGAMPLGDEAANRERLALVQSLYQVPDLEDEAYRQYLAVSPAPPDIRDVSVGWVRLSDWCEHAGVPLARSTELGRVGHRPMLAELSRVAVLPSFQWMPVLDESGAAISGFHMRRLVFRAGDASSPLLMHRAPGRAVLRLPRELPVLPGPALLLGGMPQYYHQTIEHLGTLAIAETMGVPADVQLVVNHDLAPFQLEQFALLGIGEDRLIRVKPDAPVRFERLWVASRPVMGGRWVDPLMPAWYRRRLALPPGPGRRKLYLSRAGTTRRRVVNETAVMDLLTARGFEVVQPETLGVREQARLFAEASHIVAPTGAALTNMIFAAPGARVVAIYHRAFAAIDVDRYFDALAEACGHGFQWVEATAVAAHESGRTIDADIEVNLDELAAALD